MIVSRILAAGLLAVSALGAPSPVEQEGTPQAVGRWTLSGFEHGCAEMTNFCYWQFNINENKGENATYCHTSFSSKQLSYAYILPTRCEDGWGNEDKRYIFWGEWNSPDFDLFTITVVNTVENAEAIFDFHDYELAENVHPGPKEAEAFTNGDPDAFNPHLDDDSDDDLGNDSTPLKIRDETESDEDDFWQIQGMNRDYRTASHLTYLDFTIVLTDGKRENCHLIVPETEPDSSFYAIPCGVSGYTVSWGYKADTDGGVMTICNPALHKNAWFGWDGIGRRSYLGDSPRNVARTVDCE